MNNEHHATPETFSSCVQTLLHSSGYAQKELADALGLNHKVLSRKLNNSGKARLNHQNIQKIILQLVDWNIITTRDDVLRLLELAHLEPSFFSVHQWQTPPLDTLAIRNAPSPSSIAIVPSSSHPHNIPAATTRLIGRTWAVERLRLLFARKDVRIVTLSGSGGSGKTRLALHVAEEIRGDFTHGVWYVPLASINTANQLPMSIIQAMHIASTPTLSPLQSLLTYLKDRQLLLVLDNFEQLTETTPLLDEMLAKVPGLKLLITSRVVLHMYGEYEFRVPPLDLPSASTMPNAAQLLQYGSIQLFIERARAAIPDITITDEDIILIMHICHRIDGLPLAIELAAARLKTLSLSHLLERLTKARLPLLTGGSKNRPVHQRTLRHTIAWSYQLLSPDEQTWFNRLGIFTGGWSLDDAEAIMHDTVTPDYAEAALDVLEHLVDHSLIVRFTTNDQQLRFTMLETLREYALEQLAARGEVERLRDWHASYYTQKAEMAEMGLRGPQQRAWLALQTNDLGNFQSAIDWLIERTQLETRIATAHNRPEQQAQIIASSRILSVSLTTHTSCSALELCLRLAASFRPYWEWQGYLPKAREWLTAVLTQPLPTDADITTLAARAKALSEASRLLCLENNQPNAIVLAEASIALWRQLNDAPGLATALLHRGWAAHAQQDYETASAVYEEGLACLANEKDAWLAAQLLLYLGDVAGFNSNFVQMHVFYTQSKALFEQIGDKSALADLLKDQGGMLILESKYTEAIACLQESIMLCEELDHKQYITTGMGLLSFAVGLYTEPDAVTASIRSAQIGGAAEGLMDAIGLTPWTNTNPFIQVIRQQIRMRVDDKVWENAWAAGRSLTFKQAIELACHIGKYPLTRQPTHTGIAHGLLGDLRTDQPVL